MPRCARSASRCSRPTSTSRSSRTSSPASASRRSAREILDSLTAGQQVVKIVNDELVDAPRRRRPDVPPARATRRSSRWSASRARARRPPPPSSPGTSSSQGRRPLLVAADPYRPAAADQLETLGKALDIPVHRAPVGTSVVDIARGGVEAAQRLVRDVVILDTAGRLTRRRGAHGRDRRRQRRGQAGRDAPRRRRDDRPGGRRASRQAFAAAVPVTGLILTKIDGDARGGAALSIARRDRRRRSSSWAPARRPTPSRSSTPTAWPAGSSAWATS